MWLLSLPCANTFHSFSNLVVQSILAEADKKQWLKREVSVVLVNPVACFLLSILWLCDFQIALIVCHIVTNWALAGYLRRENQTITRWKWLAHAKGGTVKFFPLWWDAFWFVFLLCRLAMVLMNFLDASHLLFILQWYNCSTCFYRLVWRWELYNCKLKSIPGFKKRWSELGDRVIIVDF